jgi:hypothetical protein
MTRSTLFRLVSNVGFRARSAGRDACLGDGMTARPLLLTSIALAFAFACGGEATEPTPTPTSTPDRSGDAAPEGLHRLCPDAGCVPGLECVTAAGPEGELSTCEIRCEDDVACPDGLRCNLPPVVPDSLPYICVE